jgi:hypothetical protein
MPRVSVSSAIAALVLSDADGETPRMDRSCAFPCSCYVPRMPPNVPPRAPRLLQPVSDDELAVVLTLPRSPTVRPAP